jgi:hypothetical protein
MRWIRLAAEDNKELEMGKKVEREHADTIKWLAEQLGGKVSDALMQEAVTRIAQDHLKELSDYYTKLAKMESSARS